MAGEAVDGVSRASSANTWIGAHVTLDASHTSPEYCAQRAGSEKSSVPSTTTGWLEEPSPCTTTGLPEAPEPGTVTCSRYTPGMTLMVVPAS